MGFWSVFTKIIDVIVMVWNVVRDQLPKDQTKAIENK